MEKPEERATRYQGRVNRRRNDCPCCGKSNDAATSIENDAAKPKVGDIAICGYCGAFLFYGKHLRMKYLSKKRFNRLQTSMKSYLRYHQKQVRKFLSPKLT